jgi:hypothetical protein
MKYKTFAIVIALASTITLSGMQAASATTKSQISIRVTLSTTHIAAGRTIRGVVTITNSGHATVPVKSCARNGWLFVGLANKKIVFSPAVATMSCASTVQIKPGANRFPVTVITRYEECSTKSVCPPLPIGKYHTSVVTIGLPHGTPAPAPVAVYLT